MATESKPAQDTLMFGIAWALKTPQHVQCLCNSLEPVFDSSLHILDQVQRLPKLCWVRGLAMG
eukprot:626542-Lingulodinium_polyedra.AAC.1